ncbi:MAG: hypothetical protein V7746_01565 [Halioglobus sp.]
MNKKSVGPILFFYTHRYAFLTITILTGLATYLFNAMLFQDQSLVHADNLHHGYAFLKFHHDVIHNGVSPFWTSYVYGGHPLFAEGQAGLSNPINYIVAWLFSPVFGQNLIHWLSMIALGIGTYGLSRTLSISGPASLFAALAATFSSLFIHTNSSMVAMEAMVWIPWTIWAFEAWVNKPDTTRAILFGLATAMLVFSGYPHFLHGTVIYIAASGTTLFFDRRHNDNGKQLWQKYWRTGVLAIVTCVGISCIQWLPLLELSSYSHRQDGASVKLHGEPTYALRGLIYSTVNTAITDPDNRLYFPNMGSLLVCLLASLALIRRGSARITGHLIALILLFNLGLGDGSPIYSFIVKFGLLPGIDKFRILFPYFYPAVIGIAVVAASSIDQLTRYKQCSAPRISRSALVILAGAWTLLLIYLWVDEAPVTNYVIAAAAVALYWIFSYLKQLRWFALSLLLLLIGEIFLLKLQPFKGIDNSFLLEQPSAATHIVNTDDFEQYKHLHTGMVALVFTSPYSEKLERRTKHERNSLVASTNLLWGIPSFSGALALQQQNMPAIVKLMEDEFKGNSDHRPGLRLMDIFSIKWVSRPYANASERFTHIKNANDKTILLENPYAQPRIQTYHNIKAVEDPLEALKALTEANERTLFIQTKAIPEDAMPNQAKPDDIDLKTMVFSDTRYELRSNSTSPYWLFLADSNYPGWHAQIDEKNTEIYSAQVLGKAILVPAGDHGIRLYFDSPTVKVGALVSITASLIIALTALLGFWRMRRRNFA